MARKSAAEREQEGSDAAGIARAAARLLRRAGISSAVNVTVGDSR